MTNEGVPKMNREEAIIHIVRNLSDAVDYHTPILSRPDWLYVQHRETEQDKEALAALGVPQEEIEPLLHKAFPISPDDFDEAAEMARALGVPDAMIQLAREDKNRD